MAGDLSAHRRYCPLKTFGDLTNRFAGSDAPRDIFAFGQGQRTQAAATHRQSDPPVARANRKWMTCLSSPSARPIAFFNDCPAFQRLHISARWAKDSFHRLCVMNTTFREKIYIRWCCIGRLSRDRFSGVGFLCYSLYQIRR